MSGGIPSLGLKDEDVTKFLASATHIGATNLDFQMEQYVFKRRSDGESSQKSKKLAVDCRRSTAAQFFVEEVIQETVTADRIIQLLNDAAVPKDEQGTLKNLQIVHELILHREPKLFDNFLDEVVSFQHHEDFKVRRFIVKFIEDACKLIPQTLPKVVGNLIIMLQDDSIHVQKKVIQSALSLYSVAIRWILNAKNVDEIMTATWTSISELKSKIFSLVDSDNEGIRAMAVKFIECVIISQTGKDQYSDPKSSEISLDDIPLILNVFKPRKLEIEAKEVFQKLIEFHGAPHVSSCNLTICMQVLTTIAKKRFQFFPNVLQAFESLHANLPPTLSQSQVSSVRKSLKLQLLILTKHPAACEYQSQISMLLSDLGATALQINICFPLTIPLSITHSKLPDLWKSKVLKSVASKPCVSNSTVEDLILKFTQENVVDLVLLSMLNLPQAIPAHFQNAFTPIASAGTDPQIQHLARLLATQLTAVGLVKCNDQRTDESIISNSKGSSKPIRAIVNCEIDHIPKKKPLLLIPSGSSRPIINRLFKGIDFQLHAKPIGDANKLCCAAFNRILNAKNSVLKEGAGSERIKILSTLATLFGGDLVSDLKSHILENPRKRLDLAFNWLYQEYSASKSYGNSTTSTTQQYEEAVNQLLSGILQGDEQNIPLFNQFILDLPYVTEGMAECLKSVGSNKIYTDQALGLAKSMIVRRPPQKLLFLGVISDLTLHENIDVRSNAVKAAVEIYQRDCMRSFIESFALRSVKFLLDPVPQGEDFIFFKQVPSTWTEDLVKSCLNLYIALLPSNHKLIWDLGKVYVETTPNVKRSILQGLDTPIKLIGMSPELLHFVKKFPQGAETFVTRIINILTDRRPPSIELVACVRDLYPNRVQDIRFLVPIITGLTKAEIISALPQLIKLHPNVVKEVFHRLVGVGSASPLSSAELLVALHNIDANLCSLKTIIKAISLCFEEKHVYTQVVLAIVMQQLMEQDPLPILFMRTVIQSLANHPRLLGFVTNILHRLVAKQVWTQPKIWEGFIKCCERTKPQSFPVLLQLPPPQLEQVLASYPDLCDSLCQYVENITEHQKAHIPKPVLDTIEAIKPKDSEINEPLPPGEKGK